MGGVQCDAALTMCLGNYPPEPSKLNFPDIIHPPIFADVCSDFYHEIGHAVLNLSHLKLGQMPDFVYAIGCCFCAQKRGQDRTHCGGCTPFAGKSKSGVTGNQ